LLGRIERKTMNFRNSILSWIVLPLLLGFTVSGDDHTTLAPKITPALSVPEDIPLSFIDSSRIEPMVVHDHEVGAFFDEYFSENTSRFHIPGAVIAIVKDGEILFLKGYGYANIEKNIPYNPDDTVFWAASIGKIFSVIGALQFNEQGLIDLDTDINGYLQDFQIPATYPQPITFRHLLTHTDGFEARIIGDAARSPESQRPLRKVVQENLPERVAPPGEFITYGNYGINLVGLLIEELSGLSFSDYMDQNIFQPLEMQHTTFEQSLPSEWVAGLAVGYGEGQEGYKAKPYVYVDSLPQGGGRSTATDMAHLMLALLDGGQYADARILEESSIQSMFQRQFSAHPSLGGVTCGLFEVFRNEERMLIRDGDGWGFRSRMVLIPDLLREDIVNAFMDRFYPVSTTLPVTALADPPSEVQESTGIYRPLQADESSFFKIALLFAQQIRVREASIGTLAAEPVGMGDNYGGFEGVSHWMETAPLYFPRLDGAGDLAFGKGENGEILYLFSGQKYHGTYRKISWYENPVFHFALLGISTLAFLATLIYWPLIAWVNRRRGEDMHATFTRVARWMAGTVCALHLVFIIGLMAVMGNFVEIIYGVPLLLRLILFLPLIATFLLLGQMICGEIAWRRKVWSPGARIYYTLLTLVVLGFTWWLHYWNLLGFEF
jgi:CubicO group peptidase (beta-lactamase class C family)